MEDLGWGTCGNSCSIAVMAINQMAIDPPPFSDDVAKAKEAIAKLSLKPEAISVDDCLEFLPYSKRSRFFKIAREKKSLEYAILLSLDLPPRLFEVFCDFFCDKLDKAEGRVVSLLVETSVFP